MQKPLFNKPFSFSKFRNSTFGKIHFIQNNRYVKSIGLQKKISFYLVEKENKKFRKKMFSITGKSNRKILRM